MFLPFFLGSEKDTEQKRRERERDRKRERERERKREQERERIEGRGREERLTSEGQTKNSAEILFDQYVQEIHAPTQHCHKYTKKPKHFSMKHTHSHCSVRAHKHTPTLTITL